MGDITGLHATGWSDVAENNQKGQLLMHSYKSFPPNLIFGKSGNVGCCLKYPYAVAPLPWRHNKTIKIMAAATMEEGILINVEGALQPCDICGRTFLPVPLAKHMRVCERNATRKRKVFDSLKQRVEGTELAQFHQRTYLKRQPATQNPATQNPAPEVDKRSSKWREKHLELVNTIREARGLPAEMPLSPTRAASNTAAGSERCPSCDRQFGPRAYDRHVEWCKQQRSRVQRSPAEIKLAKERLEARTKYRVPPPKSQRTLIREKYSPTLGNRTESVNSIKSVSCSNLEKSPTIRKQRSVHNTKTEREPVKLDHYSDIGEMQTLHEDNVPKQQTKEKCVPKERKIPVIEGIKSSHLPRILPRSKINSTEINSSVEGITVSHMKTGTGDMTEARRMVTWKDTVRSSTLNHVSSLKPTDNNNKKKIENAKKADKIKKGNSNKKCSKVHLTFNEDYCPLDSSRSTIEAMDDISLKHTSKKISFKNLKDDNDGHLNIRNLNKNNPHYLKSRLQENNEAVEAEDAEPENIMTSQLKVPFSISKYRKTKVVADEKLRTMEQKLQFSLENHCPTIAENDEEEPNTENGSFVSEPVSSDEYVCSTPTIKSKKLRTREQNFQYPLENYCPTITEHDEEELNTENRSLVTSKMKSSKGFNRSITLSPRVRMKEGCSSSHDSLEVVNESPPVETSTACKSFQVFSQIEDQRGTTDDNSFLLENLGNTSTQTKMYDSHKLKNSNILSAVQDICSKERHSMSTEFNRPLENSNKYIPIDTKSKGYEIVKGGTVEIGHNSKDTAGFLDKNCGEQNVTKQSLQMGYHLSKTVVSGACEIKTSGLDLIHGYESPDASPKNGSYENDLEAVYSFRGAEQNKLSRNSNNSINRRTIGAVEGKYVGRNEVDESREDITRPHKNTLIPTIGNAIPSGFKSENQVGHPNRPWSNTQASGSKTVERKDVEKNYVYENHEDINQPHKNTAAPTVGNAAPFMFRSENQDGLQNRHWGNIEDSGSKTVGGKDVGRNDVDESHEYINQPYKNAVTPTINNATPFRFKSENQDGQQNRPWSNTRASGSKIVGGKVVEKNYVDENHEDINQPCKNTAAAAVRNAAPFMFTSENQDGHQNRSWSNTHASGSKTVEGKDVEKNYVHENREDINQPHKNTAAPTVGNAAPFMFKSENQDGHQNRPWSNTQASGSKTVLGKDVEINYVDKNQGDINQPYKNAVNNTTPFRFKSENQDGHQIRPGSNRQASGSKTVRDEDVEINYVGENHEDINQPHKNIAAPTVTSNAVSFRFKFENQDDQPNRPWNNIQTFESKTFEGKDVGRNKVDESHDDITQPYKNAVTPTINNATPFRFKSENQDGNQNRPWSNRQASGSKPVQGKDVEKSYANESREDITRPHKNTAVPTIGNAVPFRVKSENQGSESNFDFDSLENCTKISNTAIKDEENEKFDAIDCPQKRSQPSMEEKRAPIKKLSKSDISILHKPSYEVAEMESLECINVDAWNEALSMARIERSVRRCCSAVGLNPYKSQENNFATYTELDLTKFSIDNAAVQGCCVRFIYQTDEVFVEGAHMELQSDQADERTSDRILEIAGDQFVASFRGDGDGLSSAKSSISSIDGIPIKRRKLSDNVRDFIGCTSSSSDCSSIGNTINTILFEHSLNKNLKKIKSRKKKLELRLGGGEAVATYGGFDNSQQQIFENNDAFLQDAELDLTNKYRNTEISVESHTSGIHSNRSEDDLIKNFEEETAVYSPVGIQLMENQNNYNLEANYNTTTSSDVPDTMSPRLLEIIASVIDEDNCYVIDQDCTKEEDMLVISKQHCKNLLELDPHRLDLSSKIKFPQIQSKNIKDSSNNQKMTSDYVESTNFTLPPIKLKSGTSKIPVASSSLGHQESNPSPCCKEPVSLPMFPKLCTSSDKQSDYNPFVTAERQLMELLECDDFRPFFRNKSPSTQHLQRPHTTTNTKSKLTDIHKNNKIVKSAENARKSNIKVGPISKRSSVIDPPMDFQDNRNILSDDFELIERLINQNYADGYDLNDINFDSISNRIAKSVFLHSDANENNNSALTTKERKYSDDMSSIDPRLINENDNLSIPENLKIDDNSSNSSNDNVTPLISNLHKENYDSKHAPKTTTTEKINRSLNRNNSVAIKRSKQISDDKRSIQPLKQVTKGTHKSTASLTSSYGSTRNNLSTDKKRNLSSLKRSVSLVDPVKPKNLRNKQDVENYFDEQERKNAIKPERISPERQVALRASPDRQAAHRDSPDRQAGNRTSPDRQTTKTQKSENNSNISNTPAAEELFSVDDEMYEEYKKYEEMYLREKQQHIQNEKKPEEFVSSGTLTPNEGSDNVPTNVKVSADSAYSSLNRNTPKIRARSTKLAPLDCQGSHSSPLGSPTSSGSETSPTFLSRSAASHRMSKFCHECGNKYPINTAKFCVECGVRRLVL